MRIAMRVPGRGWAPHGFQLTNNVVLRYAGVYWLEIDNEVISSSSSSGVTNPDGGSGGTVTTWPSDDLSFPTPLSDPTAGPSGHREAIDLHEIATLGVSPSRLEKD